MISSFFSLLFLVCIFVFPFVITAANIINLVCTKSENKTIVGLREKKRAWDKAAVIYGTFLAVLCIGLISDFSWDEPVILGVMSFTELHEPFSEKYMLSFYLFWGSGILSFLILDGKRRRPLPPLAAAVCVGGIYTEFIFFGFMTAQLLKNFPENFWASVAAFYIILYQFNFVVCSVRVLRETVKTYTDYFAENGIAPKNKFAAKIEDILQKSSGMIWFPLAAVIPVTGVLICICIICGQGASGIIKAFTETSDWTFSAMVSPPPEIYSGHYLCTVAVNGHEKVVKPQRMGIRGGRRIVVNRQLCAANAFEQLIEDKAPKFHRTVRYIYDRYGYPLSKHITTKLRADIVYIVMKPLEWLFVAALYLFDSDPESRIAVQYTGKKLKDFDM
ncbi:MAG: hypothetical protein NC120_09555 [Ruminococcus sp.]|nr:hypothetical protein [Ruminococcus sp.]